MVIWLKFLTEFDKRLVCFNFWEKLRKLLALPYLFTARGFQNEVTEYCIAFLRGKNLAQRIKALIAIVVPEARDEIVNAAF